MRMADVPVALLAGGLATRLRPITATVPKALVEVAGRPFIDHQLQLLARNGVRHVILCVGHLGEQIERRLGTSAHGIELTYSYDGSAPLGTGGALRGALPLLGDVFWVLYGDSYLEVDYAAALERFANAGALGLMTVLRNQGRWDASNVVFRDGRLLRYSKRERSADMSHIDFGAALLRRAAVERLPRDQSSDLADLYSQLVERGEMVAFEVHHRFYEIGSHGGLAETDAYLRRAS
jgi:NDP-sugar pyrophosphorylase family protein